RQPREVDDFRRRERMKPERRIPGLDCTEQVLVPLDWQVRVVTSLQQQLTAAEGHRLVDLTEHLLEPEDVTLLRSDGPVERAEVAARNADVRVIDVAVDDVGDDAVRVLAMTDRVGELAEKRRRCTLVQLECLDRLQTAAATNLLRQLLNAHRTPAATPPRPDRAPLRGHSSATALRAPAHPACTEYFLSSTA